MLSLGKSTISVEVFMTNTLLSLMFTSFLFDDIIAPRLPIKIIKKMIEAKKIPATVANV